MKKGTGFSEGQRYSLIGFLMVLLLSVALVVTGCESKKSTQGDGGTQAAGVEEVVIGVDIPLTGQFSVWGNCHRLGYTAYIDKINNEGGLDIGGKKVKIKLVILDNESDPQKASQQATTLVLQHKAIALFGPATPPLSVPVAQVAETRKVPFIATSSPIRSFASSAPQGGWKYAWDMMWDEKEATLLQFKTMDLVESNKKIALFTAQDSDGETMGKMWEDNAPKYGYKIVYRAQFPNGTTDYSDFIRRAKKSGADICIAQVIPPDGMAIRKQMKSMDWKPKAAFFERAGGQDSWWNELKEDAEGTLVYNNWTRTGGLPQTDEALKLFDKKEGIVNTDFEMGVCVLGYSVANVMCDAIVAAGSTDPDKICEAIGKINGTYMCGPVKFDQDHLAALPIFECQWHNGQAPQVYPPINEFKIIHPMP